VQNITESSVVSYTNFQAAPLDLINGHLGDGSYRAASRGFPSQNEPKNWFVAFEKSIDNRIPFVVRVQPFESGGYELTMTKVDLDKMVRTMESVHTSAKRIQGEQDENNVISSINRSKKKIRYLIKSMGCDRLATFTIRQNDPSKYLTIEEWGAAWDRLLRLCKKANCRFQYVAVLEHHKSGAYHLHAALVGRANVVMLRRLWFIALGCKGDERGVSSPGNVDIKYRADLSRSERLAGIAKYMSKYVSKQLGHTEFNKKRYWASRHTLPSPVRYMLAAENMEDAVLELNKLLSVNLKTSEGLMPGVYVFPSGNGLWFNYDESLAAEPPF
jgi:hypothetical protein